MNEGKYVSQDNDVRSNVGQSLGPEIEDLIVSLRPSSSVHQKDLWVSQVSLTYNIETYSLGSPLRAIGTQPNLACHAEVLNTFGEIIKEAAGITYFSVNLE